MRSLQVKRTYARHVYFGAILLLLPIARCGLDGKRYSIPSSAMVPTLLIGDTVLATGLGDGEPRRGDVIVFQYRFASDPLDGEDSVKRVIGLPGDRVRLENDVIYINDQPLKTKIVDGSAQCGIFGRDWDERPQAYCPCVIQEESTDNKIWRTQHLKEGCGRREGWSGNWPQEDKPMHLFKYFGNKANNPDWPNVVVPAGNVFVMGDNRDSSEDSRFFGFVTSRQLRAKVTRVVGNASDANRADISLE